MENRTFKFYFKRDNNYFYIDMNGSVGLGTPKVAIDDAVSGWENLELTLTRNMAYWGVFKKFSTDLRFVNDGAKIMRNIYYKEGFQGRCTLMIEKLNTASQVYEFWTTADFDFTQTNDQEDYFDCSSLDGGLISLIEGRKDSPYSIDLKALQPVNAIMLPGLWLNYYYKWLSQFDTGAIGDQGGMNYFFAPALSNASDSDYDYFQYTLVKKDQPMMHNPDELNAPKNGFLVSNSIDTYVVKKMVLNGVIELQVNNGSYYTVQPRLSYWPSLTAPKQIINLGPPSPQFGAGMGIISSYHLDVTLNDFPIEKGYYTLEFFLKVGISATTNVFSARTLEELTFEMSGIAKNPSSGIIGMRYIDFVKDIVRQMTDNKYQFQSNFLSNPNSTSAIERKKNYDNSPFNTWVTCGDAIKQADVMKLTSTFQDILKDCWSRWALAMFVDNDVIRLEPLSTLFTTTNLGSLPKVNNFNVMPFKDHAFNKIKVGQKDFDYGQLNGRMEQSNEHRYLLSSVDRYTKEDDLTTQFRTDIYGIEWVRREAFNSIPDPEGTMYVNSADGTSDVFLIECNPTPKYNVRFDAYYYNVYQAGTMLSPEFAINNIYNVPLTTKRMLLRHLRRIRSLTMDGWINFQASDKNYGIGTVLNSGEIWEHHSVNLSLSLSSQGGGLTLSEWYGGLPLFQPVVFEFDCVPDYNMISILASSMDGYYEFTYRDTVFKGYILEIGVVPATRDKYKFKLLSHKDNDLTKLIK